VRLEREAAPECVMSSRGPRVKEHCFWRDLLLR